MFKKAKFFSALSLCLLLFSPLTVRAEWIFNGGYHLGTTASGIEGASCKITYNSEPITYGASQSTAWVMLDNPNHTEKFAYAQVGWLKSPWFDGKTKYFWEYAGATRSDPYGRRGTINESGADNAGPALGSTHTFKVNYDTKGQAVGYIDYAEYFRDNINWYPVRADYYGEATSTDAQLPGKASKHEVISEVLMWTKLSNSWITPNLEWTPLTSITGRSTTNYNTNGYFEIWDTRY